MRSIIHALLIMGFFTACNSSSKKGNTASESEQAADISNQDTFYQYSIWFAFVNKVFDGDLKVSELKTKGDIGLGSFDFLDGEMVMLDGIPYRVRESGEITPGADDDEIVYADAAFFDLDGSFTIPEGVNFEAFKTALDENMRSVQYFYAYKVHGTFSHVKLGGVPKVEKPFTDGLDVLLPIRPVFETNNISGTLIGFFCPKYIGNINAAGHHFHFISDDRKWGGHMMDFTASDPLLVGFDEMTSYAFDLPANADFENVVLDKEFQYNK